MSKKKVFIDPGHGGSDPGAVGAKSKEAENVLAVALALEKKLIAQGYDVKLSRRTNVFVSLNDRAKMANDWGADIFLSLHDNSAVNKTATGFETFVFNGSNVSANSIKLQQHVHKAIIKGIGLRDRGMKRANFAVVRLTKMPAVLIEYGFISNLNDERIIAFEIDKQAQLTFEGINSYFGVKTSIPTPVAPKVNNQKHFLNTVKNHIADCWTKYKILPSVVLAQAILESGWGTSDKAVKANNLFGIKANSDWKGATVTLPTKEYVSSKWITVDAKWRKYNSWGDSIVDHAAFLSKSRYKNLIGNTDYKSVCLELQKAGYATDPAYANKLIAVIEANNLTQFDHVKEEEKVYSSGSLKAEHEITRSSAARRKIIVEAAIKAGYNEVWREKLEDGTITADDVDALAAGTLVKNHKQ